MTDPVGEVRARTDIVELIGQTHPLKRAGKHWKGLCPFHPDKDPSLSVSRDTGRYKCWACGASGDVFNWIMNTQRVEFKDALKLLADRAGIKLGKSQPSAAGSRSRQIEAMECALEYFRSQLAGSQAAKAYLEKRELDGATVERWELGYAPDLGEALAAHLKRQGFKLSECQPLFLVEGDEREGYRDRFRGRLMFPIRDERGVLVAFGGRIMGDGVPKYINSGDTPLYRKSRVLYGFSNAKESIEKRRRAVLVEGYLDVIACHRAGVREAVASLGTSLSDEHASMFKRWCDEVLVLYDSDSAGEKAAVRAAEMLVKEGVRVKVALMPPGDDPDTLLRQHGPDAVQKAAEGGMSPLEFRMSRIRRDMTPDQDEFWQAAVEALSESSAQLEVERQIEILKGQYPGLRDAVAASNAIRTMVKRAREGIATVHTGKGSVETQGTPDTQRRIPKPKLLGSESALLQACLEPEWRELCWSAFRRSELFVTRAAETAAAVLSQTFADGPPSGSPSVWLAEIEDSRVVDLLVELDMHRPHRLSAEYLNDAVADLEHRLRYREAQELRATTDEPVDENAVLEKLREMHRARAVKPFRTTQEL